ncbi:MAG: redoxin domain-containing protein [Balneolales bacterium]
MISKGEKIDTGITLKVCQQGTIRETAFSDLLTRKTIVSVYMKNNTGSCDKQNKSLAAHSAEFDELGFNVLAISKDTCRSHKNYSDKLDIGYTLVSDPDYVFASATDSIVKKKMYGKTFDAPSRSAFVINTDGTVLEVIEKIDAENHSEELLDLIKSSSL